jgi:DNA-binding response OmpR family regulator
MFTEQTPSTNKIPRQLLPEEVAVRDRDRTTLLVVEDVPELLEFLCVRFRDQYRVLQACDGEEGLATAFAELPDLIVTDVNMPRMDGLEMLKSLRQSDTLASVPVVILAARYTVESRLAGIQHGADDYLPKPFNMSLLDARIQALLKNRRTLRAQLMRELASTEAAAAGIRLDTPNVVNSNNDDMFRSRIETIILSRLADESFGVAALASELFMERTTLFKRMRAAGLPSAVSMIREVRLTAAARLLDEQQGQISDVAYACGFESLSYFTKSFKERYQATPSEYVKRSR